MELSDFFLDYRKTALHPGELIKAMSFELPQENFFKVYKTSIRKDLDISSVNFSMFATSDKKSFRIAAGGVAAIPLRLTKTENYLSQNTIDPHSIDQAIEILHSEFVPLSDVRGTGPYRRVVIENFFRRAIANLEMHR